MRDSCSLCCSLLVLVAISLYVTIVESHLSCDVNINKRVYRPDKSLYTHKQYEVAFGLPWEASNPPIGYAIDVDCKNVSKLRAAFAFDLKDMPIEINSINCSKTMHFIHVLEPTNNVLSTASKNSSRNSYLTFLIDFRWLDILK